MVLQKSEFIALKYYDNSPFHGVVNRLQKHTSFSEMPKTVDVVNNCD